MARHRRGTAEWAALIDEWKQGGLDLAEFCRRRGLSRGTMQGWVYKTPLKRAIEATRRQRSGEVAKASPQANPAESPSSIAFLPVRCGSPRTWCRNAPPTPPPSRSSWAQGGASSSGRGSMRRHCDGSSLPWS